MVELLVDNDTSAVASRRPGWEALLAGIADGRYEAVVVWHPDRAMRSLKGLADLLSAVQAHGTAVATVNAGDVDLTSAAGRLQASILTSVAAHEREHTGERVKAAQRQRRERGLPMGRTAWGWGPDRTSADPVLRAALVEVAESIAAGGSLRAAAQRLADGGHPAPAGGDGWDADSVRALLRRPANVGLYRDGRRGAWDPLLTDDLAARVVEVMSDPARRSTASTARTRLLGGIARCALHGDPMYARHQKHTGRDVYTPRERQCCSAPVVEVDHLVTEAVLTYLEREDVRPAEVDDGGAALGELNAARLAADELDAELAAGRLDGRRWSTLNAAVAARIERAEVALDARRSATALRGIGGPGVRRVWSGLSVARRSAIVAELVTVTVTPGRKGQRGFDPGRVAVEWRS